MFIEKLTREQIGNYFGTEQILSVTMSTGPDELGIEEPIMYVTYTSEYGFEKHEKLHDFEGSRISNTLEYKRFMYDTFGDEYLSAYQKWLDARVHNEINAITEAHIEIYTPKNSQIRDKIIEEIELPGNVAAYKRNIREYTIKHRATFKVYSQYFEEEYRQNCGDILIIYGPNGASSFINNGTNITIVELIGKEFSKIAPVPKPL